MTASGTLLTLRDIGWHHDGRQILRDVDLTLDAGEILTVIGPNGAGKTCLIRIALGLLQPDHGERWLRAGTRVGYVPQKLRLNSYLPLTVAEFLAIPPHASGKGPRRLSTAAVTRALAEVDADHLLQRPTHALSGGEHQRVLLARALLRTPELLVLDEPVQGVDLAGQAALYALIGTLRQRLGCAVLMVSHDLHVVMAATDRVLCLNGHVCCTGHPEAVSRDPAYRELFGVAGAGSLAIYTHHHDHHHTLHGDARHCGEECHHD